MASVGPCEPEHDFALVLAGQDELTDEVERTVALSGCSDATLAARLGRVYLFFSRQASTREEAVASAIEDMRQADTLGDSSAMRRFTAGDAHA